MLIDRVQQRLAVAVVHLLALVPLLASLDSNAAPKPKDYENFGLPLSGSRRVPESGLNYSAKDKLEIKGNRLRLEQRSVDHKTFLFAKEAFISERRDQAIKLLRQELDSNYQANRDNMLLRLGQLYAEKYMELSFREVELLTEQLADYEKKKVKDKSLKAPKIDNSRSQKYLKDALAIFYNLEREYPKHPKMDEILFFIGFVEMESGHGEKGAPYLQRVVQNYPRSRKFDEAVVYLGDYHFDKQKFGMAQSLYQRLVYRKDSALQPYAHYKVSWCKLNTSRQKEALSGMKILVDELDGTQDKAKFNLREQALKDLVIFYGEVGTVEEAVAYFTNKVGREKALTNLRLLADGFKAKAKDEEAVKAYGILIGEFPDGLDTPLLNVSLSDAQTRTGRSNQAVETLAQAIEKFGPESSWAKKWKDEKSTELRTALQNLEEEGKRLAFFYHAAAQKGADKRLYNYALRIYGALIENFPNHPDRKKIAFYRAEILYSQGKFMEAADSYMTASKMPPKDKLTDEAVYSALLALDQVTAKTDKLEKLAKEDVQKAKLTPIELPTGETRFIEVAEYYLKEYPKSERFVDVQFRVASVYYRYQHYEQAAERFKQIAMQNPKHRSATTAAAIALDIYNVKKDFLTLEATANRFASIEGLGDTKFKADMKQITEEISFKKIEDLEKNNQWAEAGEAYYKVYRANPSSPLAEKSLYNALVSFEKANDTNRVAEVTKVFVAKFPKSLNTERLTLTLAKNAEKQFDYELAQRLYLDYHRKFPNGKESKKALYNAAVFAELLELNKEAVTLFNQYSKEKGVTADERKAITISLAKLYRKEGQWDGFNRSYRQLIREAKTSEEKLSFLGEMARNYERYEKVSEKNQVLTEMRSVFQSSGRNTKNAGPAIYYVAEAEFRATVAQREKYNKIELRFPPEDLIYLMGRKEKALVKLAPVYDSIVEIGVPDWGVAALHEKSEAYFDYVKAFRKVKIPAKYQSAEKEEAEKSLKSIDDQRIKPLEAKAKDFLKVCASKAAEFNVINEYAAKCRERSQDSNEVARPFGIIPQPTFWTTRIVGEEVAKK